MLYIKHYYLLGSNWTIFAGAGTRLDVDSGPVFARVCETHRGRNVHKSNTRTCKEITTAERCATHHCFAGTCKGTVTRRPSFVVRYEFKVPFFNKMRFIYLVYCGQVWIQTIKSSSS
jgi:hypothetical protein